MADYAADTSLNVEVSGEDGLRRLAAALQNLQSQSASVQQAVQAGSVGATLRQAQSQVKGIAEEATSEGTRIGFKVGQIFGSTLVNTLKAPFEVLRATADVGGRAVLRMGGAMGQVAQSAGVGSTALFGFAVAVAGLAGPILSLVAGIKLMRSSFTWAQEAAQEQLRVAGRTARFYPGLIGEALQGAEEEMRSRMGVATAIFGQGADQMQESITRRLTAFRVGRGLRGEKTIFSRWGITPTTVQRFEAEGGRIDLTKWLELWVIQREKLQADLERATTPEEKAIAQRRLVMLADDTTKIFGQKFSDMVGAFGSTDITRFQRQVSAAQRIGISPDATRNSVQFTIALESLKATFNALKTGIGLDVQPAITDFLTALNEKMLNVEDGGKGFGQALRGLASDMANNAWQALADLLKEIDFDTVNGWLDAIREWKPAETARSIKDLVYGLLEFAKIIVQLTSTISGFVNSLPSWLTGVKEEKKPAAPTAPEAPIPRARPTEEAQRQFAERAEPIGEETSFQKGAREYLEGKTRTFVDRLKGFPERFKESPLANLIRGRGFVSSAAAAAVEAGPPEEATPFAPIQPPPREELAEQALEEAAVATAQIDATQGQLKNWSEQLAELPNEAPRDGKRYVRKNEAWIELPEDEEEGGPATAAGPGAQEALTTGGIQAALGAGGGGGAMPVQAAPEAAAAPTAAAPSAAPTAPAPPASGGGMWNSIKNMMGFGGQGATAPGAQAAGQQPAAAAAAAGGGAAPPPGGAAAPSPPPVTTPAPSPSPPPAPVTPAGAEAPSAPAPSAGAAPGAAAPSTGGGGGWWESMRKRFGMGVQPASYTGAEAQPSPPAQTAQALASNAAGRAMAVSANVESTPGGPALSIKQQLAEGGRQPELPGASPEEQRKQMQANAVAPSPPVPPSIAATGPTGRGTGMPTLPPAAGGEAGGIDDTSKSAMQWGAYGAALALEPTFPGISTITHATQRAAGMGSQGFGFGDVARGAVPGMGVLEAIKKDSETPGNPLRSRLRNMLGIEDPGEPAPWQPGGANFPESATQLTARPTFADRWESFGGLTSDDGANFGAAAAQSLREGLQGISIPSGYPVTSQGVTPRSAPKQTGGDTATEA